MSASTAHIRKPTGPSEHVRTIIMMIERMFISIPLVITKTESREQINDSLLNGVNFDRQGFPTWLGGTVEGIQRLSKREHINIPSYG